jgi:hypothetical protein
MPHIRLSRYTQDGVALRVPLSHAAKHKTKVRIQSSHPCYAIQNHLLDVLPNAALLLLRKIDGHLATVYFHMQRRLFNVFTRNLLFHDLPPFMLVTRKSQPFRMKQKSQKSLCAWS